MSAASPENGTWGTAHVRRKATPIGRHTPSAEEITTIMYGLTMASLIAAQIMSQTMSRRKPSIFSKNAMARRNRSCSASITPRHTLHGGSVSIRKMFGINMIAARSIPRRTCRSIHGSRRRPRRATRLNPDAKTSKATTPPSRPWIQALEIL